MARRPAVALILLWAATTLVNVDKAFHIDDPTYLIVARHLIEEPLRPLTGSFVLSGHTSAIGSTLLSPPLVLYGYAATIALFGESEIALHLFFSLFGAIAIFGFHALARQLCPSLALPLTAMLALGPAFLPGQNLMMDVPMVGLWTVFFWILIARLPAGGAGPAAAAAGLVAGLASLVKYPSLALVPILLGALLVRRDWRRLWAVLIPIGLFGAWSLWNLLDIGVVHLLSRELYASEGVDPLALRPGHLVDWVVCLGSASPFSVLVLPWAARRGRRAAALAGLAAAAFAFHAAWSAEPVPAAALGHAFFANGVLVLTAAGVSLGGAFRERPWAVALLVAWLGSAALFVLLFAPFMAVRHVMLVMPPLLIALGWLVEGQAAARSVARLAVVLCAVLGSWLAASDWSYADAYREVARNVRERFGPDARLWYLGNWGWRWYAEAEGMQPYLHGRTRLAPGDIVVIPEIPTGAWDLDPADRPRVTTLDRIDVAAPAPATLRTMLPPPMRGYYGFSSPGLPWSVSREPLERFWVYRVR